MKKELFLLCALPYLLSAQNVEVKNVLKEKPIIQRLFKSLPVENQKQITTYAGAENNLPDSIFMYSDEDKKELASKTFITYDENERKSLVWSYSFYYWEDTVDSVLSKTVYLYTLKDGLLEIEATSKYYALDVWINYEKSVMVFRETDLNNPIEDHEYSYNEITLEWEPYLEMAAVEFDDENRPVVYDAENYETIMRIEVSYNENGLRNSVKSYIAMDIPEEPWQLNQEGELTYNDDLQLVKDVFYLYDMEETITGEYEYDEKGNLSYEITVFEGEGYREEFEAFYTNFYESVIDANEVILSFQSAVYPNPVSDVMNVTVEGADNALITLVNINGSIVFQQKTSRRVTPISVKSLTKGYYFLTVQAGKQMKTYKILIR